ncbi:hypothetical protein EKO23_19745 [Nocardioides guangzhouensis]|uniref:Glycosyltransferase family 2 protein n=1 Tax=Nocardioides guangzhouensis TaxID=2497878 RepID=A0A4Q4Z5W0_9ACTN|nr:hypothetical protein [Nocardioides guangzhouensis]RYP83167.1 hypothetical protein EKO23_19745 [Nocardioides guangzhouensis]
MTVDDIRNREGERDFDVRWPWGRVHLPHGLTAVLRVKDEARNLPWVLPPLLGVVDRAVLVDNGSIDGTPDLARTIADHHGLGHRLDVTSYPFPVSRCGAEHLATPANSVHSLVHYYNWSFSHARTAYSLKWDGDMVLTAEGAAMIGDLLWQIESEPTVVVFQHHPLYVESERVGYFDVQLVNTEPWIHPMGPEFTYVKGFDWEVRRHSDEIRKITLPQGLCFELKWLDADEFSHWTTTDAFDPSRTPRKVRELEVFSCLREGRHAELEGVVRIEAPEGVHIVDHVARTWLPSAERPLRS